MHTCSSTSGKHFQDHSMAKRFMGLHVIKEETPQNEQERWLLEKVHYFSRKGGLTKMPEVALYNSPELNAFATGPSRNDSLVAVSTGLLSHMSESEVEGVLAHEVSHITNGDMVSMALLQGVINTLAIFIGRILAKIVMEFLKTDSIFMYFALISMFEILLTLLGSIGVYKFSRWREFRADRGGAELAGKEKMISALQALQKYSDVNNLAFEQNKNPQARNLDTFKISGRRKSSLIAMLFSSHPPLETRIRVLQRSRIV